MCFLWVFCLSKCVPLLWSTEWSSICVSPCSVWWNSFSVHLQIDREINSSTVGNSWLSVATSCHRHSPATPVVGSSPAHTTITCDLAAGLLSDHSGISLKLSDFFCLSLLWAQCSNTKWAATHGPATFKPTTTNNLLKPSFHFGPTIPHKYSSPTITFSFFVVFFSATTKLTTTTSQSHKHSLDVYESQDWHHET